MLFFGRTDLDTCTDEKGIFVVDLTVGDVQAVELLWAELPQDLRGLLVNEVGDGLVVLCEHYEIVLALLVFRVWCL